MDRDFLEPVVRLGCFIGVLALMAGWELLAPHRLLRLRRSSRWASNLGLVAINSVAQRLVLSAGGAGIALLAAERKWGLLNATAMFNHANVRMPAWLDLVLRLVVVTPDMHRAHHSVIPRETNSNFDFNLPWWDFLFGTCRAQPVADHETMAIGLAQFRHERVAQLPWMLALPFVGAPGDYPVNRDGPAPQPALPAGNGKLMPT